MGKNVFLSCVSEKADHKCKAEELYLSPLFQKSLAYARTLNPDNIYILSAKYFVVDLDEEIAPYDITLKDMNADQKREWVDNVLKKCEEKGINRDDETVFLAGHAYLDYLLEYFSNYTVPYQDAGLEGIGHILQWLDQQIGVELASQIDFKFNECQKNKNRNMKSKLMKLARMIMELAEIETDKGVLIYEGELVEGVEVFIEKDGEFVPADDGEYIVEGKTIVVAEGKVKEIIEVEKEPEVKETVEVIENEDVIVDEKPAENTINNEEKDLRIKELEDLVAEKDAKIAELEAEIEEMKSKLQMSADKSPKEKMKEIEEAVKNNPALKYFNTNK